MTLLPKLKAKLLQRPKTTNYQPMRFQPFRVPRDLPHFSFSTIRQMLWDPTIRLGLAMRAAPLHQAEFAFKETDAQGNDKWTPGVKSDDPAVGKFVMRQYRHIWDNYLDKLLQAQIWGWTGGEVTYKLQDDKVHVDKLLHRHAMDTFALQRGGIQIGVQVQSIPEVGAVDLKFPGAFWHAFDPQAESPYGVSILVGAYSPWADKWLDGGALDTRRLFMFKDAYGGVDVGYPPDGTVQIDGDEIPIRDIAREIAEQATSGSVTTRPLVRDENGNEMWTITRAQVPSNPQHILQFPRDLDVEMLRGLEIPDDVLTSEATGAWQGKQVPMQAFFTNGDRWLRRLVRDVREFIVDPLVTLNWGRPQQYEVQTKPLAEQAMEQIAGEQPQQSAVPFNPAQPQSLEPVQRRFSFDVADVDQPTQVEPTIGEIAEQFGLTRAEERVLRKMANGDATRLGPSKSNGTATDVAWLFGLNDDETKRLRSMTNGRA